MNEGPVISPVTFRFPSTVKRIGTLSHLPSSRFALRIALVSPCSTPVAMNRQVLLQ